MSVSTRVDECRQITVTRLRFTRGSGTPSDVVRIVTQYWLNNVLLVEQDPMPAEVDSESPDCHDCTKHRVDGSCAVCTVVNQRDVAVRQLTGLRRDLAKLLAEHGGMP